MNKQHKGHPFIKNTFLDKTFFFLKFFVVVFLSLHLIAIKFICDFIIPKKTIFIPMLFHKLIIWLLNISITKQGKIINDKQGLLFVSNHISYLDIPILGSIMSVKFIAKNEVSKWPIFGILAKIGNTIFIKRVKANIFKEKDIIKNQIDNGFKIILFPEGTTSDGIRILDFKSSLLSSIECQDYMIQPIVIKYKGINGFPLNRSLKPIIAWYGDMVLKRHLFDVLQLFSITARVTFLNPIFSKDFENRKSMTFALQNVILKEYSQKN